MIKRLVGLFSTVALVVIVLVGGLVYWLGGGTDVPDVSPIMGEAISNPSIDKETGLPVVMITAPGKKAEKYYLFSEGARMAMNKSLDAEAAKMEKMTQELRAIEHSTGCI